MKILFNNWWCTPRHNLSLSQISDYQADMLFHGLFKTQDIVTTSQYHHMFQEHYTQEQLNQIWGKGFTIYGKLPRAEEKRLYGDYGTITHIIVPMHWTVCGRNGVDFIRHLENTREMYPNAKIAVVDGWDRVDLGSIWSFCKDNKIAYFKRELLEPEEGVFPISFAFPEEMVPNFLSSEGRDFDVAPLVPVNQSIDASYMSTYIYDTEESYYEMYQRSKFALTSKKGGWETLRHYEIMANGAIPVFVDIKYCPDTILTTMPKDLLKQVNRLHGLQLNTRRGSIWEPGHENSLPDCSYIERDNPGTSTVSNERFQELQKKFNDHFLNNCLTKHLAKYVLETMNDYN